MKARVILFRNCHRSCLNCCNNYIGQTKIQKPVLIDSTKELLKHNPEKIMITGGEPLLNPIKTFNFIMNLRRSGFKGKIFLYTTIFDKAFASNVFPNLIDGVHYTLHRSAKIEDPHHFKAFQDMMKHFPDLSCRLYIEPEYPYDVLIKPDLWKRIELKPWILEGECELPKDEVLFELKPKTK